MISFFRFLSGGVNGILCCSAFTLFLAFGSPNDAIAQSKVALVIGNNAYLKIWSLNNAVNDALTISKELRAAGFAVTELVDAKSAELVEAQEKFLTAIRNGGIGVFYFAGHGVQLEGRNYLLPTDLSELTEKSVVQQALSFPKLLDDLEKAKPRFSVMILDACRDNPFIEVIERGAKTRGLAEVAQRIPSGTLVLYSASANQTALDSVSSTDRNANGLFTSKLLRFMREPGLEVRDLARRVRGSVLEKARAVGHIQVPALYDNLTDGEFYFRTQPATVAQFQRPANIGPIKIIVPTGVGNPIDRVSRYLALLLGQKLGTQVSIENQSDIQGDRVAGLAASANPDGRTLLVSPFTASLRRFRASDQRLVPIGMTAELPLAIAVRADIGISSLTELQGVAKQRGRPFSLAVSGPGTVSELCGQELVKALGSQNVTPAQYATVSGPGAPTAVDAVVGGRAEMICEVATAFFSMLRQAN